MTPSRPDEPLVIARLEKGRKFLKRNADPRVRVADSESLSVYPLDHVFGE